MVLERVAVVVNESQSLLNRCGASQQIAEVAQRIAEVAEWIAMVSQQVSEVAE
jgi:hypothetical protein